MDPTTDGGDERRDGADDRECDEESRDGADESEGGEQRDEENDGVYRVLPGRDPDEWLLLEVESADPTYVDRSALPDVEAGNRLAAALSWDDGEPVVERVRVEAETVVRFVRTDEAAFEAARSTFRDARAAGESMNSRVTHGTDGEPNGVVYTFAGQAGSRDLFAEFRDGGTPLEPLLARAARSEVADPPFSVWVLDPEDPFVLVYIVLDPDGLLEETMWETYG